MKLIPNDVTIFQQFKMLEALEAGIRRWASERFKNQIGNYFAFVHTPTSLAILEEECGIRCELLGVSGNSKQLCGFEMTDEKKYAWFSLKYM